MTNIKESLEGFVGGVGEFFSFDHPLFSFAENYWEVQEENRARELKNEQISMRSNNYKNSRMLGVATATIGFCYALYEISKCVK